MIGSPLREVFMRPVAILVLAVASLACPGVHADNAERVCINPKEGPPGPDTTVACYSDKGCALAASLSAEPIRDYDVESAPFALARGKISAIVTAAPDVIKIAEKNGAVCRAQKE
jgi:hypothetical protein